MAIDLTGGIDPAREQVFARRPDDPEMRDSVSFWVVDDRGEVGLPRIGIEAVAANWDAHDVQVNVAFPDGRVFRLRETARAGPPKGPTAARPCSAPGGLGFRCVEPFDTWTMTLRRQGRADLVERSDRRQARTGRWSTSASTSRRRWRSRRGCRARCPPRRARG